jgi:hypothetical protein
MISKNFRGSAATVGVTLKPNISDTIKVILVIGNFSGCFRGNVTRFEIEFHLFAKRQEFGVLLIGFAMLGVNSSGAEGLGAGGGRKIR